MTRMTLADTLLELIGALDVPEAAGLVVQDVQISVPVEVRLSTGERGTQLEAAPPGTIWTSGFELPVNRLRLTAVAAPIEPFEPAGRQDGS